MPTNRDGSYLHCVAVGDGVVVGHCDAITVRSGFVHKICPSKSGVPVGSFLFTQQWVDGPFIELIDARRSGPSSLSDPLLNTLAGAKRPYIDVDVDATHPSSRLRDSIRNEIQHWISGVRKVHCIPICRDGDDWVCPSVNRTSGQSISINSRQKKRRKRRLQTFVNVRFLTEH